MGLIKAALAGAGSTLADQWLEYFYCDSLSNDVLVERGTKRVEGGSNTKGSKNIITNGSGIAVNEGQAMLIVEDGKVVDFTVEPGRFVWDTSTEPSLFDSGWKGLKESFKIFGKRFAMGGTPGKDQRVYFINLKEIFDNKFGSSTPMSYKDPTYRAIYIRYYGSFTFKITDPIVFFSNVSGNVRNQYTKEELMEQCSAEFIGALDESLARCSDEGYQFNDLPKKQREIASFMNDTLDEEWHRRRGLSVEAVAIAKVTPDEESRKRIETIDDAIMMSDVRVAAGRLAGAQATAMERASENTAGAFTGFLGMGMAGAAPGPAGSVLNAMGENGASPFFRTQGTGQRTGQGAGQTSGQGQPGPEAGAGAGREARAEAGQGAQRETGQTTQREAGQTTQTENGQGGGLKEWACSCGAKNRGKFCSECGRPKPEKSSWICSCGAENQGKFCTECGKPRPSGGFICSNEACGFTSEQNMKFCPNCGSPNKKV